MRTLLVFYFIASSAVAARAQIAPTVVAPQTQQTLVQRAEIAGALLRADRIELRQGTVYLQGNVRITLGGVVIAAADNGTIEAGTLRLGGNVGTTIENGALRLDGNVRLSLPAK